MAVTNWNIDTTIDALNDEEKKKKLTPSDLVKIKDVLWSQDNSDEDDAHRTLRETAQMAIAAEVQKRIDTLAQSDISSAKIDDLNTYTRLLETYSKGSNGYTGTAAEVMKKIETRTLEIKQQSVEAVNNAPNLSPADLWVLRQNLNAIPNDNEVLEANKKLENTIVMQAEKVANNSTVILDINQGYSLQKLLQDVHEHPLSDETKNNTAIIEKAQAQIKDMIDVFEEQYGLGDHLTDEKTVLRNIETLKGMPSDEELFSYNEPESKLTPELPFENIRGAFEDAVKKGETFELSRLSGVLQDKTLKLPQYDSQRNTLLEMALKRVKETDVAKLAPKDLANFEMVLQKLQASEKNDDKKTAKLLNEKQKALETTRKKVRGDAKYPEFASVMNVLENLQVDGGVTPFGREKIAQNGADSDINLFKESIRQRTEMFLANTSKEEITEEVFREAYSEQLKLGIVEVVYADRISKGNLSKKDMLKMFDDLDKAATKGKPIRINQTSIVGWQAVQNNRMNTAANRVESQGQNTAKTTWFRRVRLLDSKYLEKYPRLYPLLKSATVSAGWGTAYGIASTLGPGGIAVVASASFAYSGYKFFRTYVESRKQAHAEGKKFSFWKFLKNNKLQAAGFALSTASAVFGISSAVHAASAGMAWAQEGLGLATQDSSLAATFQLAKAKAGYLLASAGAVNQFNKAFKKRDENDNRSFRKRLWDGSRASLVSAGSFFIGMYAGRAGGTIGSHYLGVDADTVDIAADTGVETLTVQQTIGNEPVNDAPIGPEPFVFEETKAEPAAHAAPQPEYKQEPAATPVQEHKTPTSTAPEHQTEPQPSQSVTTDNNEPEVRRITPLSAEEMKPHLDVKIEVNIPTPEELKLDFELQQAQNLGVQTIERLDNGNISVDRISPEGRHYQSVVSPDGKFVSLIIEGKDFPSDRLDAINNPEKGIQSSILQQNQQLFMIAPAIGEEMKDFTQPSTETVETAAEEKTTEIKEDEIVSDNEKTSFYISNPVEEMVLTDIGKNPNIEAEAETTTELPNTIRRPIDEESIALSDKFKFTSFLERDNIRDEDEPLRGKDIHMDVPSVTDNPIVDHANSHNGSQDGNEHKDKDKNQSTPEERKSGNDFSSIQNLNLSESTINWNDGTEIKSGTYIEAYDKSHHLQILGRDENGHLYKLTQLDVGWSLDLPKDHPDYETLQTSSQRTNVSDMISRIKSGSSSDRLSALSDFINNDGATSKSVDAGQQINSLTEKLLHNLGSQSNVTNEWKNTQSAEGETSFSSNSSTQNNLLSYLSGRNTNTNSSQETAQTDTPTEHRTIAGMRGIGTNGASHSSGSLSTPTNSAPIQLQAVRKSYA